MSTIDVSSRLAAMVRAQFGTQFGAQAMHRAAGGTNAARSETAAKRDAGNSQAAAEGDAALQQMVALRVRALSPDDPQRQRKAFRIFLESVLVQTFGRDRLDARGFDQLTDAVLERMDSDAELRAALREAGALLLADQGPTDPAP